MPLTDTAVRNAKRREKPQKLSDGGGLHLLVNPDGARPSQARQKQKRAARLSAENTFEIVAREWCENQKDGWTGRYHDHVVTRLEADVFPELGSRPIAYENIRCVQSALTRRHNVR